MQHATDLVRLEEQRETAQRDEPDGAREAAEPLHRDYIDGRQACRRIQAQTNCRTRERRKPEVVPERVRDERREQQARVRYGLAQVPHPQEVVEAQDPVAERGDAECCQHG